MQNGAEWGRGAGKRFPIRVVRVMSGSGRNGPLFRDVQDRIDELADVLKAVAVRRCRSSLSTLPVGIPPRDCPLRPRLDQLLRSEVARCHGSRRTDVVPSPGTCSIQFFFRTR